MIKFIRTFLFNRKFPEGYTDDCCHICGKPFHNRDYVLNLKDDQFVPHLVHASVYCAWGMAKKYKKRYYHKTAKPYLIASGKAKWVP
jgi:hypothetical protein